MLAQALVGAVLCLTAQTARQPTRLDPGAAGDAVSLAADVAGELAAVAWVESQAGAHRVWIAVSRDGARAWDAPQRLDADPGFSRKELQPASGAVVGDEIRVLWLDGRHGQDNVYQRVSRDGGLNWEAEARVADGYAAGSTRVRRFEARALGAADVAIALLQALPGGDEVRIARSLDGSRSYAAGPALHAGGIALALDFERDGALAHLAWTDDTVTPGLQTVRYLRSPDGGTTWPGPIVPVSGTINAIEGVLDLAAAGARVSVVFQDLFAIHAVGSNHSVDGGLQWLPVPLRVAGSRSPSVTPSHPRLFLAPQDVVVVWTDDRSSPGLTTPWLAGTRDSGATWFETALDAGAGAGMTIAGDGADGSFAAAWIGAGAILAAGSRAAAPQPLPAFSAAAAAGNLSSLRHAYDPAYAHHLLAWIEADTAGAHPWVGGLRVPHAAPLGPLTAGAPLAFGLAGARAADAGRSFRALLSHAPGLAPLPWGDGRLTGLAPGAWLTASAGAPALAGVVGADGSGLTGSATIPPSLPAGTRVHYACVIFDAAARTFGDLTDAESFTTL